MGAFKSEVVATTLAFPHGTGTLLVLPKSIDCPKCHRSVRLAVNRAGTTVCLGCDEGEQQTLRTSAPK